MKSLSRKIIATAVLALGMGAGGTTYAATLMDFTVDEGSVPGNAPVTFTADKINGAYSEKITFDGGGNFVTNAYADFGEFLSNDGTVTVVISQLLATYGLYSTFASDGSVAACGPFTCFSGANGSFNLYIDPNLDTTKTLGATGADPVVLGNTADDYLIAFATDLGSAFGTLVPGIGGFFDLVFEDFTLVNPEGTSYFTSPDPFYIRVNVDGDFDSFTVAGTQTVTGDVSAVFLPEPTLPALLGMVGLIGFGFSRRKQS